MDNRAMRLVAGRWPSSPPDRKTSTSADHIVTRSLRPASPIGKRSQLEPPAHREASVGMRQRG